MLGPKVPETSFSERAGIIAVDQAVNSARCIWRETSTRDVGIDGHIEHVSVDRVATGRMVAVQVKSGASYFSRATAIEVPYSAEEKHRAYWAAHPIPVVLVLHNPDDGSLIWIDARTTLRNGDGSIRVPRSQVLDDSGVLRALESAGPLPCEPSDPHELVSTMLNSACGQPKFGLTYFDLFFQGLTDVAHSLYFGMDLPTEILDFKAALPGGSGMVGIGEGEFAFIDSYVTFLVAHDLARVDLDAWTRMSQRFEMVGRFVCPLTAKGEALVDFVRVSDERLGGADGTFRVVHERWVQMVMSGFDERAARIEFFRTKMA